MQKMNHKTLKWIATLRIGIPWSFKSLKEGLGDQTLYKLSFFQNIKKFLNRRFAKRACISNLKI
jgi:hypothetical protein